MWELDYKESWVLKNWCFWTVVLEKTLESPLECKEIQPVHPKGDQSWVFIERTDVEAETPVLWPPDVKSWLIWKDPNAGKVWGQEKGMTKDEMVGWHHWLNGHGFGWTLGVGDGQGGLVCCDSWAHRVGHNLATELNWIKYRGKTNIYLVLSRYQVLLKYTLTLFISITPCMREVLSSPFYGLSTLKLRWKCLPQITSLERENMQTLDSKILFSTMKSWPRKLTFYIPKRH